MSDGWIKLHRKLLDSRVFKNEGLLQLWVYCLCRANHQKTYVPIQTGRGESEVEVRPGQFIFGRTSVSREIKMNPSTLYKRMLKLEKLGNINIKSNNHYSIVSICNWDTYQDKDKEKEQAKEQASSRQVTGKEQASNTDKNDKNVKNIDYVQFVDLWNEVNGCNRRITDSKRTQIRARLRTYSEDELKTAIRNRSRNDWINGEGKKFKTDWDSFWRNDEKAERYLLESNTEPEFNPEHSKKFRNAWK